MIYKKKRYRPPSGYVSNTRNKNIIFLFVLISFLNFTHNLRVSSENTGRNFQYAAWQSLTKESNLFSNVKTSDIFLSTNQDDSFETNAGSFYSNTGIRLAYLFNTRIIFPNFSTCNIALGCNLDGIRQKTISTLPNLTRGTFVPTRRDPRRIDDWVGINSKSGALVNKTIWAFDVFLLTPTTYFSYLVPFSGDEKITKVNLMKLRAVTITSNQKNEFIPAIANICLEQSSQITSKSGTLLTEWRIPKFPIDPAGTQVTVPDTLDFRLITAGTCAPK